MVRVAYPIPIHRGGLESLTCVQSGTCPAGALPAAVTRVDGSGCMVMQEASSARAEGEPAGPATPPSKATPTGKASHRSVPVEFRLCNAAGPLPTPSKDKVEQLSTSETVRVDIQMYHGEEQRTEARGGSSGPRSDAEACIQVPPHPSYLTRTVCGVAIACLAGGGAESQRAAGAAAAQGAARRGDGAAQPSPQPTQGGQEFSRACATAHTQGHGHQHRGSHSRAPQEVLSRSPSLAFLPVCACEEG
jgi:hypothetical protein